MENYIHEKLKKIEELIKTQLIQRKELMTTEEVAMYLGMSKSSIYKLIEEGKIPHHSPEGVRRKYFKKSEIDQWIADSVVMSQEEAMNEVDFFLNPDYKTEACHHD